MYDANSSGVMVRYFSSRVPYNRHVKTPIKSGYKWRHTNQVKIFFSASEDFAASESIAYTPSLKFITTDAGIRCPGVKSVGLDHQ